MSRAYYLGNGGPYINHEGPNVMPPPWVSAWDADRRGWPVRLPEARIGPITPRWPIPSAHGGPVGGKHDSLGGLASPDTLALYHPTASIFYRAPRLGALGQNGEDAPPVDDVVTADDYQPPDEPPEERHPPGFDWDPFAEERPPGPGEPSPVEERPPGPGDSQIGAQVGQFLTGLTASLPNVLRGLFPAGLPPLWTPCPRGTYWSGSTCAPTPSSCPSGTYWTGSACRAWSLLDVFGGGGNGGEGGGEGEGGYFQLASGRWILPALVGGGVLVLIVATRRR